jgi:hypothetical protein
MAKLATDILAIRDMVNSFKNSNLKVEDIFNIINQNEGFFFATENVFAIDEFLDQDGFDEIEFAFEEMKDKKGKRYLN